jgi:hypothetical protein
VEGRLDSFGRVFSRLSAARSAPDASERVRTRQRECAPAAGLRVHGAVDMATCRTRTTYPVVVLARGPSGVCPGAALCAANSEDY